MTAYIAGADGKRFCVVKSEGLLTGGRNIDKVNLTTVLPDLTFAAEPGDGHWGDWLNMDFCIMYVYVTEERMICLCHGYKAEYGEITYKFLRIEVDVTSVTYMAI